MPVYPVTEVAKFITGTNVQAYIVKNSGSETVYLGQDSSLTVETRAFSITPGGVLQWPGDSTEIWAVTEAGKVSELELLYNSQATYIPGPDSVSVKPVLDNLFYVSVTPSDKIYQSGWVEVLPYQTLVIETVALAQGGAIYNGESDIRIRVEWSTTASVVTSYESEIFGAPGIGSCNYRMPVVSRFVRFTISRKNTSIDLQTINFKVNGLNYPVPTRYMSIPEPTAYDLSQFGAYNQPVGYADDYIRAGSFSVNGSMANTRNGFAPIPHIAGMASWGWGRMVMTGTGTATTQIGILTSTAISFAMRKVINAAGTLEWEGLSFALPKWPVAIQVQTSGASAALASWIANLNYQG